MMRSLYSGVSGLKTHQTKMDVIGNNIANVNTVGFKASTVTFSELFYQTTQVASGPNAETNTGGQNAKQIGLGTSLGAISVNVLGEGGSQTTGNPFDLKINGDSFFVVNSGGVNYFTKAGNFTTDANGNLVTQSGAFVMGYVSDSPGGTLQTDQVRPLSVYGAQYMYTTPEATTNATISGNINAADDKFTADTPSPITSSISFFDNLGNEYSVQLFITQDTDTTAANYPNNYTVSTGSVMSGSNVMADYTAALTVPADNELVFDGSTGLIDTTACNPVMEITLAGSDAFTTPITVDLSTITSYGTKTALTEKKGDIDGEGTGKSVGKMSSVGIDTSGKIIASYSNGDNYAIGQISVSNFDNPSGLEKIGDNMFAATLNSGEFNGIGLDITAAGGSITSGVLEMSNVDLASEFTDMIVTQRGFQANSRIITTSDTMIEELLGLKR